MVINRFVDVTGPLRNFVALSLVPHRIGTISIPGAFFAHAGRMG